MSTRTSLASALSQPVVEARHRPRGVTRGLDERGALRRRHQLQLVGVLEQAEPVWRRRAQEADRAIQTHLRAVERVSLLLSLLMRIPYRVGCVRNVMRHAITLVQILVCLFVHHHHLALLLMVIIYPQLVYLPNRYLMSSHSLLGCEKLNLRTLLKRKLLDQAWCSRTMYRIG